MLGGSQPGLAMAFLALFPLGKNFSARRVAVRRLGVKGRRGRKNSEQNKTDGNEFAPHDGFFPCIC
jgi:hypothetical protein